MWCWKERIHTKSGSGLLLGVFTPSWVTVPRVKYAHHLDSEAGYALAYRCALVSCDHWSLITIEVLFINFSIILINFLFFLVIILHLLRCLNLSPIKSLRKYLSSDDRYHRWSGSNVFSGFSISHKISSVLWLLSTDHRWYRWSLYK